MRRFLHRAAIHLDPDTLRSHAYFAHDRRHEYPECPVHGGGGIAGNAAAACRHDDSADIPGDSLAECGGRRCDLLIDAGIRDAFRGVDDWTSLILRSLLSVLCSG